MSGKPCYHCGQTFTHGNRKACCSGCGRAFIGQTAFDIHQSIRSGSVVCADPATIVTKDGTPRLKRLEIRRHGAIDVFWQLTPRPGQQHPWAKEADK